MKKIYSISLVFSFAFFLNFSSFAQDLSTDKKPFTRCFAVADSDTDLQSYQVSNVFCPSSSHTEISASQRNDEQDENRKNYLWVGLAGGFYTFPGLELSYRSVKGTGLELNFSAFNHGNQEAYKNVSIQFDQSLSKVTHPGRPRLTAEFGFGSEIRRFSLPNLPNGNSLSFRNQTPYLFVGPAALIPMGRRQRVFFEIRIPLFFEQALNELNTGSGQDWHTFLNPFIGLKVRLGKKMIPSN